MMTSATKSEEKRRDWSVQRGVDHNKIRVNQAVETRNRAQFLGQVPKQQRKSYRRLARGTKHRQHARKGILLGECRLIYRRDDLSVENYLTLPLFNDLHHVTPSGWGTLLIAVTGLDMVVEIKPDGTVLNEWNVLGQDPWQRFARDVDYRKVQSTKPHHAHPNFVFTIGDAVWTTRCDLNDAVCLTTPGRRIDLIGNRENPVQFVHDGVTANGRVYFTSVDGHILVVDPDSLQVTDVVDIGAILDYNMPLGWCRGIKVLDGNRVIVGFSRLRSTRLKDKVSWAKAQVKKIAGVGDYTETLPLLPTRICCLDLGVRRMEWELDLEGSGMNAVFSIL